MNGFGSHPDENPVWTVIYDIHSKRWQGSGFEFFDAEKDAQECLDRRIALGAQGFKRPFCPRCDRAGMAAAHLTHVSPECPMMAYRTAEDRKGNA